MSSLSTSELNAKPKSSGKCMKCTSGKDLWYGFPSTDGNPFRREKCIDCKLPGMIGYRSDKKNKNSNALPKTPLEKEGYTVLPLPTNQTISFNDVRSILYDEDGKINTGNKSSNWTHIFNNSFKDTSNTHRYMKKFDVTDPTATYVNSLLTAFVSKA
jgi:hypothetical protein